MKTELSVICQTATILDFIEKKAQSYAETVKIETPGLYHKPAHKEKCPYVICWPNNLATNYFSQMAPYQMQPAMIEEAFKQAMPIHTSTLADLYAGIFGSPRRKRGVK